jgi:hypothetical protein
LGRHHHPHHTGLTDHVPPFSARMTTATILASAPQPTWTLTPLISTSMIPEVLPSCRIIAAAYRDETKDDSRRNGFVARQDRDA